MRHLWILFGTSIALAACGGAKPATTMPPTATETETAPMAEPAGGGMPADEPEAEPTDPVVTQPAAAQPVPNSTTRGPMKKPSKTSDPCDGGE